MTVSGLADHRIDGNGQRICTAYDAIDTLLDRSAELDPHHPSTAQLLADARRVTARLAADGLVPTHLVVGPDDPVVVAVRTLAATRRHLALPVAAPHPLDSSNGRPGR